MIFTIYLDMDGVITDFHGSVLRMFGVDINYNDPRGKKKYFWLDPYLNTTIDDIRKAVDSHGISFWSSMRFTPWCADLIDVLRSCKDNVEIVALSCPFNYKYAASGKSISLERLGISDFICCPSRFKHRLASPHSVLIDDCDQTISEFRFHGGAVIPFPQHWNRANAWAHSHESRVDYVRKQLTTMNLLSNNLCSRIEH